MKNLGLIAIDIQKNFVEIAFNPAKSLSNIQQIFRIAQDRQLPFFITYEASDDNDFSHPKDLVLPDNHQKFIKTTFAATDQMNFRQSLLNSGITRFALFGSETDVCILQTALGLRKLGFEVLLVQDAIFSSEPNISPALRRLQRAGVQLANTAEIGQNSFSSPSFNSAVPETSFSEVQFSDFDPLQVALDFQGLEETDISQAADPFKTEKLVRMRELLILAAWTQIPVVGLQQVPESILTISSPKCRPALEKLNRCSLVATEGSKTFLAGVMAQDISSPILSPEQNHPCNSAFAIEDALLGYTKPRDEYIPITYKSFYYGITRSISPDDWASPEWQIRLPDFQSLFAEREALPPILFHRPR